MKILYLTRTPGTDVRASHICNSLCKMGHEVIFVGWDRTPEKPKDIQLLPGIRRRILKRQGIFEKNSFVGWGDYVPFVVRTLWEERPDAVQAVNEDEAMLVIPFKHLLYRYLVIDVPDSVIANKFRTRWLDMAARICRCIGNLCADGIVETSDDLQDMLGRHKRKSIIMENSTFPDPGWALSELTPVEGPVRLALGGGLTNRRMGLSWLIEAVDSLPPRSVVIEASGWLGDDYAKERFAKHPAVNYRWLPSVEKFHEMAATCDAIPYLRTDAHESAYRGAVLPTRLFSALALGRPLIVNRGMAISKWIESDGLGQVVPDFDVPALAQSIRRLETARRDLPKTAKRMREAFLTAHTWEMMEQRLARLYLDLSSGVKSFID